MSLFKKLKGIIGDTFQLDKVNSGPLLKNNSGSVDFRDNSDSSFVNVRVATPVSDNDAVNKLYADSLSKPIIVSRQADTSSSLPPNTSVEGFVVVTTPGSGAVIGDILKDDGSNSGNMSNLGTENGRVIAVTQALTGGSQEFEADSLYIWDGDGSQWIKVSDIGSVTGAVRAIRYSLDNTATQDSSQQIPASAIVHKVNLKITTPYSGGATIEIGNSSTSDLIMLDSDNLAQALADTIFSVEQDTSWPSAEVVRTTISGSPGAGAAEVIVFYSNPNG